MTDSHNLDGMPASRSARAMKCIAELLFVGCILIGQIFFQAVAVLALGALFMAVAIPLGYGSAWVQRQIPVIPIGIAILVVIPLSGLALGLMAMITKPFLLRLQELWTSFFDSIRDWKRTELGWRIDEKDND